VDVQQDDRWGVLLHNLPRVIHGMGDWQHGVALLFQDVPQHICFDKLILHYQDKPFHVFKDNAY
jgi:hypothetical protein